jgi:hypothetical protein
MLLLLNAATGKELRRFDCWAGFAPSPDGRHFASGSKEETVRLRESATGKELYRLGRHWQWPRFAFSPDGKTLTWAGVDRTVRLWEVASGKVRRQLEGHGGVVTAVAFSPDGKWVVSASNDTTLLVWDGMGRRPGAGERLSPEDLERLWAELAGDDAARAYRAVRTLAAVPGQAVPLLLRRVRPVGAPAPGQVRRLLSELDSTGFSARERAARELRQLGELAAPALRQALEGRPSLEVRRRVLELLDGLNGPVTSPAELRVLRLVEVLESSGTPEAKRTLEALARGAPEARLTGEAQASLERLTQRVGTVP